MKLLTQYQEKSLSDQDVHESIQHLQKEEFNQVDKEY